MGRRADLEYKDAAVALPPFPLRRVDRADGVIEYKALGEVGGLTLDPDDPEGTAWCIVAVTGVEDDVKDVIHAGAFKSTLAKRQLKGCYGHEWNRQIAVQRKAIELMPGDSRLPKHIEAPDGSKIPWPAEAGALAVKAGYILDTEDGRNAWYQAKANQGQQAYSIGYKVNKARHDENGVRHIYDLDVFEFSPVLHGAHPMARLVGVKTAQGRAEVKASGTLELPDEIEFKVRYVRDAEYWGYPYGTPITGAMKPRGPKARSLRRQGRAAPATAGTTSASPTKPAKAPKPLAPAQRTARVTAPIQGDVEPEPEGLFEAPKPAPGSIVRASRRATGDIDTQLDQLNALHADEIGADKVMRALVREGATPEEIREGLAERRGVDLNPDPNAPRKFGSQDDEGAADIDEYVEAYREHYEAAGQRQILGEGTGGEGDPDGVDDPRLDAMLNTVEDFWAGEELPESVEERLNKAEAAADRGDLVTAASLAESALYGEEFEGTDIAHRSEAKLRKARAEVSVAARDLSGGQPATLRHRLAERAMADLPTEVDEARTDDDFERNTVLAGLNTEPEQLDGDAIHDLRQNFDTDGLKGSVQDAALAAIAAGEGQNDEQRAGSITGLAKERGLDPRDVADEVERITAELDPATPQDYRDMRGIAEQVRGPDPSLNRAAQDRLAQLQEQERNRPTGPDVPAAETAPESAPQTAPEAPAAPTAPTAPTPTDDEADLSGVSPEARSLAKQVGKMKTIGQIEATLDRTDDDTLDGLAKIFASQFPNSQRTKVIADHKDRRGFDALGKMNAGAREEQLSGLSDDELRELRSRVFRAESFHLRRNQMRDRGPQQRMARIGKTINSLLEDRDAEKNGRPEFTPRNVLAFISDANMDTGEVAQNFGVSKPRALRMLKDLADRGYLAQHSGDNEGGPDSAVSGGRKRVQDFAWESAEGRDADPDALLARYDADNPGEAPEPEAAAPEAPEVPEAPAAPDPEAEAADARDRAETALQNGDAAALADALGDMGIPAEDDPEGLARDLLTLPPERARNRLAAIEQGNVLDARTRAPEPAVAEAEQRAAREEAPEAEAPEAPEAPQPTPAGEPFPTGRRPAEDVAPGMVIQLFGDDAEHEIASVEPGSDGPETTDLVTTDGERLTLGNQENVRVVGGTRRGAEGGAEPGAEEGDEETVDVSPEELQAARQVGNEEPPAAPEGAPEAAPEAAPAAAPEASEAPPAPQPDPVAERIESEEVADALDAAAADALGLTEAEDGELEVDLDVADRQDRVEAMLDRADAGELNLSESSDAELSTARSDLVAELALQTEISRRDRRNAARRQQEAGGNGTTAVAAAGAPTESDDETATPDDSNTPERPAEPVRRPGLAGAAEDYADAIESGDADAMRAARARLESSLRRSRATGPEVDAVREMLDAVGPDGHPEPDAVRQAAEMLRKAARDRRNTAARTRRTAKRLERERIRSLIGQINSEMVSRGMTPEEHGGPVVDDRTDGDDVAASPATPRAPAVPTTTVDQRDDVRRAGRNPVTGGIDVTQAPVLADAPAGVIPDQTVEKLRNAMATPIAGYDDGGGRYPDRYQWDTAIISPGGGIYAVKSRETGDFVLMHHTGLRLGTQADEGVGKLSPADMRAMLDGIERAQVDGRRMDWTTENPHEVVAQLRELGQHNVWQSGRAAVASRNADTRADGRTMSIFGVSAGKLDEINGTGYNPVNGRQGGHVAENALEGAMRAVNDSFNGGTVQKVRLYDKRTPDQIAADKISARTVTSARNLNRLGAPDRAIALLEARADALDGADLGERAADSMNAGTTDHGAQALRDAANAIRLQHAKGPVLPHALREEMRPGDRFVIDLGDGPEIWTFDGTVGGRGYGQSGGFTATGPDGISREMRTGLGAGMRSGRLEVMPGPDADANAWARSAREGRMLPLAEGESAPSTPEEFIAAHDQFIRAQFGADSEAAVDDWKQRLAANGTTAALTATRRRERAAGTRRSTPRRRSAAPAETAVSTVPNAAEVGKMGAAQRRAALMGRLAEVADFADEPHTTYARTVDDVRQQFRDAPAGTRQGDMKRALAGQEGFWRNSKLSDGGAFLVSADGNITHTPSGMSFGRVFDGVSAKQALRTANALERLTINGEPADWSDDARPRAMEQIAAVAGQAGDTESRSANGALKRINNWAAAGDPTVTAKDFLGSPDEDLMGAAPNPDMLRGARNAVLPLTNLRPTRGNYAVTYPNKTEESAARRVARAAATAHALMPFNAAAAADVLAEAVARDGDVTLNHDAKSSYTRGNAPAPGMTVREMIAPVLESIGVAADPTARTEASKLRAANFRSKVTVGKSASVHVDAPVGSGDIADKRAEQAKQVAAQIRDAIIEHGIEVGATQDGNALNSIRLPREAKLGTIDSAQGEGYLITNATSMQRQRGANYATVAMGQDDSIHVSWRQNMGRATDDESAFGTEAIVRLTLPAGSWKVGDREAIEAAANSTDPAAAPPKLTQEEVDAHIAEMEPRIKAALDEGLATERQFSADGGNTWSPERAAIHDQIVNEVWEREWAHVPSEGKALFSGGLGGAGKGTALKKLPGDIKANYGTVDPDAFKEALAERGLVPEVEDVSPMELASLIHEESSHLAGLMAKRAMRERKNLIYDITMSSEGSVAKRLDKLAAAGYQQPEAVFVDIPVEKSVERALSRHKNGLERYRAGQGYGGRYVPPSIIRAQAAPEGSPFNSANRQNFENLKDRFAQWSVFDNSVNGRNAVLIENSNGEGIGQSFAGEDGWARYLQARVDDDFADLAAGFGLQNSSPLDNPLGTYLRLGEDGNPLPDDQQPAIVRAARERQEAAGPAGQVVDPVGSDTTNPGGGGAPFPSNPVRRRQG